MVAWKKFCSSVCSLRLSFIVYRLSFISVVIYRLSLIDYRLLFIAYYHYPLSFITIIVIVYRVSFVVYRFTQTHTCAHEHTRWSFGGREAGGREGPEASQGAIYWIQAKSSTVYSNLNRWGWSFGGRAGSGYDTRSTSRFYVWKYWI